MLYFLHFHISLFVVSLAGTPSKSWRSVTKAWLELDLCSSSSFWRYANPWRWIIENKSCRQPLVRLTVELNRDRKIQLTSQSTSTSSFLISFINSRLVILRFSSNNSLPVVLFFDEYANPSRSFMYFTVWKSTPLLSKRLFSLCSCTLAKIALK